MDREERHKKVLALRERFVGVKSSNESNKKTYDRIFDTIEDEKAKGRELETYKENCIKAVKVLQKITSSRNLTARKEIEELINSALASVFTDKGYTIRIDEFPRGNTMQARLVLLEKSGKERSLSKGSGDGIKQIISFLCNILIIKFTGCSRIFISDELFDRLHPAYAKIVSDILVGLAKSLDFQFIMVEHNSYIWSNPEVNVIRLKLDKDKGLKVGKITEGMLPDETLDNSRAI